MQYDKKLMEEMADNLENYLEIIESYVIIQGITKEEYDDSVKKVKKLIKHLRKGNGDKVFDPERYRELIASGKLDDM